MTENLPSWNPDGAITQIIEFVKKVTNNYSEEEAPGYVPPEDRIATFDNDGTLWSERPVYFQGYFLLSSSLESLSKATPLTKKELFDQDSAFCIGETTETYIQAAHDFVRERNHPHDQFSDYKFIGMTYQALFELLEYLRANQFKVYICSGGGRDFVRSFSEEAYGIPPENVIGSSIVTEYDPAQGSGGSVVRTKVAEDDAEDQADKGLGQYNDQEGKPVGIQRQIGKRPILAVGNSSGDLEMFDYTDQGEENSLIVIINHDDVAREFQYNDDPDELNPDYGTDPSADEYMNESLHKAMKASNPHWIVVSMASDFLDPIFRPYPFDA